MLRRKKFGGITVAGVPVREHKHRVVQLEVALLLGILFAGPLGAYLVGLHMSVAVVGATAAIDILLLLAIALWAVRTWDY